MEMKSAKTTHPLPPFPPPKKKRKPKKTNKIHKTNYQAVSILQNISKIYQKTIYNQLNEYFHDKLFPSQCGFCKGYSYEHSLLVMTEKFKTSIDKGNEFGARLTDLLIITRLDSI